MFWVVGRRNIVGVISTFRNILSIASSGLIETIIILDFMKPEDWIEKIYRNVFSVPQYYAASNPKQL